MPVSPWLDNTPVVPVTELSSDALLDTWASHRNDFYGIMAAEEVLRRLYAHRLRTGQGLIQLLPDLQRLREANGTQQG
jgi:hypothetical protein